MLSAERYTLKTFYMKKHLLLSLVILFGMLSAGCKASYPKNSVAESVEKLIKKEYNINGQAKLTGDTLYLEVNLDGLVSTEQKVLTKILTKVEGASLVITRVALSSDASIKYMVLVASEPTFKLHLRIIQRLDDIKGYLYQKISREDYQDRLVLEIVSEQEKTLESGMENNNGIGMKEFVGRLIVSQVNMLTRSNPFLAVTLGNTQLQYIDFKDDELVVGITNGISRPITPFFKGIVNSQSLKIDKKYIGWGPKKVRLVGSNNQSTLIDITPRTVVKIKN